MFRQIIVFTKSPSLESNIGLNNAAKHIGLKLSYYNPFGELVWETSQKPINLPFIPDPETLLLLRTSGVFFDDIDLHAAEHISQSFGSALSAPINSILNLRNKDQQTMLLSRLNIPIVETLLVRGELTMAQLKSHEQWVLKSIRGNKGIGHQLLNQKELLEFWSSALLKNDIRYLLQPYLPGREVRHLVLGKKSFFIEKLGSLDWKKNLANCEFTNYMPTKEEEFHFKKVASKIQKNLGLTTFATDFLLVNNKWKVLEVNYAPGLVGAAKVFSEEIFKDFLNALLTGLR